MSVSIEALTAVANNFWRERGNLVIQEGDAAGLRKVSDIFAATKISDLSLAEKAKALEDSELFDCLSSADNLLHHCMGLFLQAYDNKAVPRDVNPEELLDPRYFPPSGHGEAQDRRFAEETASHVNRYRSAKPNVVSALVTAFNPTNEALFNNVEEGIATRLANEFEREVAEKKAQALTTVTKQDAAGVFVTAMKNLMSKLPGEYVERVLKPRIPLYIAHSNMPLKESEKALYEALLKGEGHDPAQVVKNALLTKADHHWSYDIPDFLSRREEALSIWTREIAAGNNKEAMPAYRECVKLDTPGHLLNAAREFFDIIAVDPIHYEAQPKGVMDDVLLGVPTSKQEILAARGVFERQLISVLNPGKDTDLNKPATALARKIMEDFGLGALKEAGSIRKAANAEEREVVAKKAFTQLFDAMLKQLPPQFVTEMLDAHIEHAANEAGYDTRKEPVRTVAGVLGKGKIREASSSQDVTKS